MMEWSQVKRGRMVPEDKFPFPKEQQRILLGGKFLRFRNVLGLKSA
jgi:hypothetical protein